MKVEPLAIADVRLVTPTRFADDRGFFSETYNEKLFKDAGIEADFLQDNHSLSTRKGTVRALHYQAPPFAQSKLVRVLRGSILDVVVDVRKASPTYGKWVRAVLSAENGVQIYIPKGFLHGFVTLEPDTEITYKVDAYYSKECDGAVLWCDKTLGIDWGISSKEASLSEKDQAAQRFVDFASPF
ncbi:MAG: dTDP-4-dehydrorhamnose 3,5-epimerase [Hyphomonas sp.]|nr:dTDP-4-dehydrorhamnose 3,5-epimerase [Hyphomonas sp.]